MLAFGKIPSYQGTENVEVRVSKDRRAIAMAFNGFEAVAGGKSVPVVSRLFNFVIPLEGDDKTAEIEFNLSGQVTTVQGGTATLVASVNGQSTTLDRPKEFDDSYVHTLTFKGDRPPECRLSVLLLAGRNSSTDSDTFLGTTGIEIEILPRIK